MSDVYVAIAIVLTLTILIAGVAYRLARRSRGVGIVVALACVGLLIANVALWRDSLGPARLLPFSSMIVVADINPPLVGALVGLGAALLPGGRLRRCVLLVPLAGLCLWSSYGKLWQRPENFDDRWSHGVCRQTTPATCTPAAAATLLTFHGIPTTEREMARLCLTTPGGTPMRGLYRGLMLKTAGTRLRVLPFRGTIEQLRAAAAAGGPMILTVRLEMGAKVDPRFEREWGWAPGVAHHVVLFRFDRGGRILEVGDPAVGREYWGVDALEALWHGEAIQLRGE
jgi:hypothetical protein